MATRTNAATVTFARSFILRRTGQELPPGSYPIETDEETLEGVSTPTWRRVEIRMFVPRIAGKSEAEMWIISPGELDEILKQDREPANPRAANVDKGAPHLAAVRPPPQEIAMRSPDKGGNGPLYGAVLGILALLFATWIVNQQNAVVASPAAPQSTMPN